MHLTNKVMTAASWSLERNESMKTDMLREKIEKLKKMATSNVADALD